MESWKTGYHKIIDIIQGYQAIVYVIIALVLVTYFACCFVWVWNLVVEIEGGKEAEGVWEHSVEENIWT